MDRDKQESIMESILGAIMTLAAMSVVVISGMIMFWVVLSIWKFLF